MPVIIQQWISLLSAWITSDATLLGALAAWLATFSLGEAGGIFILTYALSDTIDLNVALVFVFLGSFSADMFWYGVTVSALRPWFEKRFKKRQKDTDAALTIPMINYAKKHPYIVLLLIKFLMGLRLILTITIASRRDISFSTYLLCNIVANILFVGALYSISSFVHESVGDALDLKNNIFHLLTLIVIIGVGSQILFRFSERFVTQYITRNRR